FSSSDPSDAAWLSLIIPTITPIESPSPSVSEYEIVIVCILWFGGHTVVGLHVTMPSLHGVEPLPPARGCVGGCARAGTTAAAITRLAMTARMMVRFMGLPFFFEQPSRPLNRLEGTIPRDVTKLTISSQMGQATCGIRPGAAARPGQRRRPRR